MEDAQLLREDALAWKTTHYKRNYRTYCHSHAVPVLILCTFVTSLCLFIVVVQNHLGLYRPLGPKIYSEAAHHQRDSDLLNHVGPIEGILSYVLMSPEDSIHVSTRFMSHKNNGLPSIATDTAWAELYLGMSMISHLFPSTSLTKGE